VTGGSHHAILVIHPGALGDVLQAVPVLRALRSRGSLTFSGQPRLGKLLLGLGLVDAVLPFDGLGLEALFTPTSPPPRLAARLAGFHRVISWFGARDEIYGKQLRATSTDCVIALPQPGESSRQTVWRHLLATVDADEPPDIAPVNVLAAWREEGQRALTELGGEPARPLLVVHPGAGARWKLWSAEHHARVVRQVIQSTEAQALIHEGPADHEIAEALLRVLDGDILHLVEPELPVLAAILARGSAYLGVDSGVSHLAAAVGTRAIVLYPSATRERWESWSPTARSLTMSAEANQVDGVAAALIEVIRDARGRSG
jgi:ADP-heptose:LPS heptosyltransferase